LVGCSIFAAEVLHDEGVRGREGVLQGRKVKQGDDVARSHTPNLRVRVREKLRIFDVGIGWLIWLSLA
jgi:hypothetical protein